MLEDGVGEKERIGTLASSPNTARNFASVADSEAMIAWTFCFSNRSRPGRKTRKSYGIKFATS